MSYPATTPHNHNHTTPKAPAKTTRYDLQQSLFFGGRSLRLHAGEFGVCICTPSFHFLRPEPGMARMRRRRRPGGISAKEARKRGGRQVVCSHDSDGYVRARCFKSAEYMKTRGKERRDKGGVHIHRWAYMVGWLFRWLPRGFRIHRRYFSSSKTIPMSQHHLFYTKKTPFLLN